VLVIERALSGHFYCVYDRRKSTTFSKSTLFDDNECKHVLSTAEFATISVVAA
jgi:hypothetical protein